MQLPQSTGEGSSTKDRFSTEDRSFTKEGASNKADLIATIMKHLHSKSKPPKKPGLLAKLIMKAKLDKNQEKPSMKNWLKRLKKNQTKKASRFEIEVKDPRRHPSQAEYEPMVRQYYEDVYNGYGYYEGYPYF